MTSRVDHGGSFASEVSAAIGGGLPEVWVPGEHDEPRDPHRSHAMVGDDPDVPQVCAKCSLPDTSPAIEMTCFAKGSGRSREKFGATEIMDALMEAALALFTRPGEPDEYEAEFFEAVALGALDLIRGRRKAARPGPLTTRAA